MNKFIKICAIIVFTASIVTMLALGQPNTVRSPESLVRAYFEAQPEFQSGSVVIENVEMISDWNVTPVRFSVVAMSARRLGIGAPDRGRHELLVIHESGEIISKISFPMKPKIHHQFGALQINSIPMIPLKTFRDALALSEVSYGDLVASIDVSKYAEESALAILNAYLRDGKMILNDTSIGDALGQLASLQTQNCERSKGIQLAGHLPDQISKFELNDLTYANITVPNLVMSNTWEAQIRAVITYGNGDSRVIQILVAGDSCDRDRVASISIW